MKVAVLRAIGDGGLQDPNTGLYISSKRDTIVPFTAWAESLANHDKIKVVEVLENSEYSEFVNHLAEAQGDEDKALEMYRKVLPAGQKGAETVRVVENAADLERQQETDKRGSRKGREAPVATQDAPAAKPAAE